MIYLMRLVGTHAHVAAVCVERECPYLIRYVKDLSFNPELYGKGADQITDPEEP